jgi:hypothetical protein
MLGNSVQLKHHLGALNKKLSTLTLPVTLLVAMPSCSWLPGFDDPRFTVHPYYTQYEVEGRVGSPSPLIPLTDLGLGDDESDYGGGMAYGDGFSGLRFDAIVMDQEPKKTRTLPANFGTVMGGDSVRSEFKMQAYRLSYTALVYDYKNQEDEWWVKAGIGPMVTYQQIRFRVDSTTSSNSQRIKLEGGIPFPAATLAAGRGPLSVTATYAYIENVAFGSDFDGSFQDIDVRVNYYFEDPDVTLFAGWRRMDLPGSKFENGVDTEADFRIKGLFLGLELTF